jgi:uncharacterized lipoprotein YajG
MSDTKQTRAITVSERLRRREAVVSAIADARLEGLTPTADVQVLFQRFIEGELTEEQLLAAIPVR